MKEVVWGIIGCGDVTEIKSGPAFNLASNSSLLAVMRRDLGKAKDYANRHNVPQYYNDAEAIINHPDINAVYIATPPSTHLEYALRVLKTNKNVYLEKPMTLNANEAKTLKEALQKSSSKLTIAHYRRKLPMFLKVKQLLDKNVLGKINMVQLNMRQSRKEMILANDVDNWRINPKISGGGYFHDLAPHQIDLLLFWLGEVIDYNGSATSEFSNPNSATKIVGVLNFKNGVNCKLNWNFIAPKGEEIDECIISGNKGSIRFPFFATDIITEIEGKKEILKFEHPKHIQQPIIQAAVNYFLGEGKNPCTIDSGLTGMKIIDAFTS